MPTQTNAAEMGLKPAIGSGTCATLVMDRSSVVQHTAGVAIRVQPPIRAERCFGVAGNWERMLGLYLTVIDDGGTLRLWYGCRGSATFKGLAYAESTDGVIWQRPELGLRSFEGSAKNNLTDLPTMEGSVLRTTTGYAFVGNLFGQGVFRWTSPDGWRWTRDTEALLAFESDTQNVVFADPLSGRYAGYVRVWVPGSNRSRQRKVGRWEADALDRPVGLTPSGKDGPFPTRQRLPHFIDEVPVVFACDKSDPPETDVYTLMPQVYPTRPPLYVAFPTFYNHAPEADNGPYQNDGVCVAHLATSRDGRQWERFDRSPYVTAALLGRKPGMVFLGLGLIERGDELWQYGAVLDTTHGQGDKRMADGDGEIWRFVQKRDRLVGAVAKAGEGQLTFVAAPLTGLALTLNLDAGTIGEARVALLDENDQPLPGFALSDCQPVRGDSLRAPVKWKTHANLRSLAGHRVLVHVALRSATLFGYSQEK